MRYRRMNAIVRLIPTIGGKRVIIQYIIYDTLLAKKIQREFYGSIQDARIVIGELKQKFNVTLTDYGILR